MQEFRVRNRIYHDGRLRQPGETVLLSDNHPTDDPNVEFVEPEIVAAPQEPEPEGDAE